MLLSPGELVAFSLLSAAVASGVFYALRAARWRVASRAWAIFVAALFVVLWGYLEAGCPQGTVGATPVDSDNADIYLARAIPLMMAALAFIGVITLAAMLVARRFASRRAG
ncbi:hypothetical protein RDV64_11050 [Acuticoccus sp. MNP-M23]|uniref:hypothetical protein n=1 Tax=Acuticoccus sp. MNP-M23 TaxID=3072793 RepID=UPI002815D787|nr:hypothetical protein [Acuticoccus sp. MNP-M23]WMS44885.1 hypothetical protein RDV64_11050 [Acuticoccus sp. MNP-M23]